MQLISQVKMMKLSRQEEDTQINLTMVSDHDYDLNDYCESPITYYICPIW